MTTIQWSIRARRCLHLALEQQGLLALESELLPLYTRLLSQLFPNQTVVVYWRAGGFDPYKLQHALLVEAFDDESSIADESQIAVAKIGVAKDVQKEAAGWRSVVPPAFGTDSVLLRLQHGSSAETDSTGRVWEAILYEDANHKIGAAEIVSLESALLGACVGNRPRCNSVYDCIVDIYHRLEQHLYAGSVVEHRGNTPIEQRILGLYYPPHSRPTDPVTNLNASPLADRLTRWQTQTHLRGARSQAHQLLRRFASESSSTLPNMPRDTIQAIEEVVALFNLASGGDTESVSIRDWLNGWLPPLMRGKTHGDLHGRNILVGLYDEQTNFPVVFDYEHAGTGKLIAWDFIKLEYETKLRAFDTVIDADGMSDFGKAVIGFEVQLWEGTERLTRQPPPPTEPSTPLVRLMSLMVTLRYLASISLGASDSRSNDWLEEYKFLSAMYATTSSKYDYNDRQRVAALLSGGIAVGRSQWNERLVQWGSDRWQAAMPDNTWQLITIIGWQQPHAIATRLRGTGQRESLQKAKAILERVVKIFPRVPQVWEDLVLVCLNLNQTDEADQKLTEALRFIERTEELMCRCGRLEKQFGIQHFDNQNWSAAVYHFERAFDYYQQAHRIHEGHYPAINMSSIRLHQSVAEQHLAHTHRSEELLRESRTIAQRLLKTRDTWPITQPSDPLWHLATEAEANYLTGDHERSTQLYEEASKHPLITPADLQCIQSQRMNNEDLAKAFRTRKN